MNFRVAFGCGTDNQNINFGQNDGPKNPIAGIFGLGMAQRSILNQLAKETNRRFSYCLPSSTIPRETHTTLSFGKDAKICGSIQKTEILPAHMQAYSVNLLGISIAEKRLHIDPEIFKLKYGPFGGFFIDTGGENKTLPSMTFHFKGANLVLDSKAVFERFNSNFCMAIFPTSDLGINILGAFQQANHRFLFDVLKLSLYGRKSIVSFAPEICQ
ncbi:aspartyl protease AED1-like [Rosa rugosa]|uniref:aspartyl protease AED1-like n=1 Tax=Rosa rugosa TaxID=74645 RepID=UPI002B41001F|nr:aspartyl protease AED1-like [Rosa rugosa]